MGPKIPLPLETEDAILDIILEDKEIVGYPILMMICHFHGKKGNLQMCFPSLPHTRIVGL